MQDIKISAAVLSKLDVLRDWHRDLYSKSGRRKRFNRMVTRSWMLEQIISEYYWRWDKDRLLAAKESLDAIVPAPELAPAASDEVKP